MGKLNTQHPRMELNSGVELVRQGFVQRAFSNLMSMDAQCTVSPLTSISLKAQKGIIHIMIAL